MPNIAIINECNLKCPYCFADEMIDVPKKKFMTPKEFAEVLNFIGRNPNRDNRIGIIGGEPTLHPQIREILKIAQDFAIENNYSVVIFTNGIELDRIVPFITRDVFSVLVNVNSPDVIGREKYDMLLENLSYVYEVFDWRDKVSVGLNVYQELQDYTFFTDLLKRFHLKSARLSIVAPTYNNYAKDKELYYKNTKDLQLNVCKNIYEAGATAYLDCNRVPDCYYTAEELKSLQTYIEERRDSFCLGPIDITVEQQVVRCFGVYDPVNLADFDSMEDIRNYFMLNNDALLHIANQTGRCKTCKRNQKMECSGGCYVFAKERKNILKSALQDIMTTN